MPSPRTKSLAANTTLIGLLIAGIAVVLPASCRIHGGRAPMAEAVSNVKQIKLMLDSFAMDNDGAYPSKATADFYGVPTSKSSNDLFRQLFASGNTDSERIFWCKQSQVCSKTKPDDMTTTGGKLDSAQILRPGDNHWAYFTGLKNVDYPALPIVLDSFVPGTTTFDKKAWDNKVIVLRVDGSTKAEPLSPAATVLDGDGKNLLTTDSMLWKDHTPDLRQPDP